MATSKKEILSEIKIAMDKAGNAKNKRREFYTLQLQMSPAKVKAIKRFLVLFRKYEKLK